jgi:signal peptidase II
MQRVNNLKSVFQRNLVFFLPALLIILTDQLSKSWIRSNILLGESIPETGFFRLVHLRNTGAIFGLFQGQSLILSIITIIGICFLLYLALFMYRQFPLLNTLLGKLSLGLILGGTVGNLIDRLSFGYVTDFIAIGIWPPFNIADSAGVVGAILLAYLLLLLAKKQ